MKAVDRTGRITGKSAIAALASPVRQEIIDTVEALGSATIAELAVQLGRPADGLYYHVRRLVRAGLLVGNGSGYRTPPATGPLRLDYDRDPAAVRRVIASMLRIARRDFDAGFAGATTRGPRRSLWAGRVTGWVGARELAEINMLIARLDKLLHRPRRRGADQLASWCFVLAPLAARPARRR
jgi:DNA-binding transcriptional ArsR family regulator